MGDLINLTLVDGYLDKEIVVNDLNIEQQITLKSLIVTYLIMVRNNTKITDFIDHFIIEVKKYHIMDYGQLYDRVIEYVYNEIKNIDLILKNFLYNGYYFHVTHDVLAESLIENRPKPWDENKLDEIQDIFKKHGKKDIFGLHTAKKECLFLSSTMQSSTFYGLASPSWFNHFTNGGLTKKNKDYGYIKRQYDVCLNSILQTCKDYNLTSEETNKVLDFFEENYQLFRDSRLPKLILFNRKDVNPCCQIPQRELQEEDLTYLKRVIKTCCSSNVILKEKIDKNKVILIKYQNEDRKKRNAK